MKPDKPYNELPLLPPEADLESPDIIKQLIKATRALAELKGTAGQLPSQNILIDILPISEAKASSEIENILTTHDKMFQALVSTLDKTDPATKEVLRYKEAMWVGYHEVQKKKLITSNLLVKIVQGITQNMAGIRNLPGTAIKNVTHNTIVYTPPEGENLIKDKLFNLEKFINTDDSYDPLIKMALIHYQFEAIHPFFDGNGRTGRILNVLYLVKEDLLQYPILYLSKYIIDHKNEYYEKIRKVTTHKMWAEWVLFMLKAVESTSVYTRDKIFGIQTLLDETIALVKKEIPGIYSKELIEHIFKQPYTTIKKTRIYLDINVKTATKYLNELERIGILSSRKDWKEIIYINKKLYDYINN